MVHGAGRLESQGEGEEMCGLQGMGNSLEVHGLLGALTVKVEHCAQGLGAQAVENAWYGLQGMGNSSEVHALLGALTVKVE